MTRPSSPSAMIDVPGPRAVFALAWPMTIKSVMLFGAVVIDAWLVAPLGERALAAIGLASALVGFAFTAVGAFSNALQLRAAQAWGTRDPVFLRSVLVNGMAINAVLGLVGFTAIWIFAPAILARLAPDAEVASLARDYLSIVAFVVLIEAVGQILTSWFNGCGRTRIPLWSFSLSVPVNIAVSYVLIHGHLGLPALGVVGAAIGSLTAAIVQLAYLGLRFRGHLADFAGARGWRGGSYPASLRRHLAFTGPIAATFVFSSLANHVCTLLYARLSLNGFAAMTLISPWIMLAGTFGMSWAQATGIKVAQLLGQGASPATLDRFLSSAWRASFLAAGVVALTYLAICLSADWIYADLTAETRAILVAFIPVLLILPFPKQSNAICGNTLRASGDTVYVMYVFLWSQWGVKVPAVAAAVLWLDLPAYWVIGVLLLDEIVKFPAFHLRLWRGDWKRAEVAA